MASDFGRQIRNFSRLVERRAERVARGAVLELGTRIITRTPVDTGRARGGWQTSIGGTAGPAPGRSPAEAERELARAAETLVVGDQVHISNAVEYVPVLERGSSAQAPRGMVEVTVAEWPDIVRRVARLARRER